MEVFMNPDIIEGFLELGNQVTEITLKFTIRISDPWKVLPL